MSQLPTPVRAAVGLAATVVDRLRRLPQEAPELPVQLVGNAMQLSLRAQQRLARLIARGDEVIGQVRGAPDDAPSWARFDDAPAPAPEPPELEVVEDLVDELADDMADDGAAELPPPPKKTPPPARNAPAKKAVAKKAAAKKVPAKKVPAKRAAPKKAAAKKVPAKKAPAKKAAPVKATAGPESVPQSVPQSVFDRTPDPEA